MTHLLGLLALSGLVLLVLLLGAIVRYSVVSPHRIRDAAARLRTPDPEGVERACGMRPPDDLVSLYKEAPFIDRAEFYLVDVSTTPSKAWFFAGFNPLTFVDVAEQRRITGVKEGIPIADDLEKGTYYVTERGEIKLRSRSGEVVVARSVRDLGAFEAHAEWGGE